nr:IS66 family insertion sequence element accessory protein TnpB [Achromobacter marplatensis]
MIRDDAAWPRIEPMDMRAGTDTALTRVQIFGSARPQHAHAFPNRTSTRMKVPVRDGLGIWLSTRRLHQGRGSRMGRCACRRNTGGNIGAGHRQDASEIPLAHVAGAFEALRAVVYDFTDSRSGEHARTFLDDWRGA